MKRYSTYVISCLGNAGQNDIPFIPTKISLIKRQTIINVEDMEKLEPSDIASGDVQWCSHFGRKIWRFLKELKIEVAILLSDSISTHVTKRI